MDYARKTIFSQDNIDTQEEIIATKYQVKEINHKQI